ncbi:ATP-dependent RNA helicase HrpA [Aestuariirhabdus sp. Z084]|uniref:ATP-dependent RNA helicase HrpA n=1 Tax=Aestuariirhabdus haliotis TaxID=2918751 RepID=UPI00201B3F90|nr:ATP-dependent RNA helicase HrpA [Aestuariirhabdus haliotis]MCL6414632.1 ATP-dependent RNA helicase HrpA [Aestuariirhabdus haliotis]MCL6418386.1 ATP-dependent RNA helicase HrpA [Aestuariirhabdus haliotis]
MRKTATELQAMLESAMLIDRHPLRRQLHQYRREKKAIPARWHQRLERSLDLAARRKAALPQPEFDLSLPVSQRWQEIAEAIEKHQVVVVAGETGSGKTTQLPKICLALGRGVEGLIGHTQPRRIAARSVASRIADELGCELGESVGYQVRFNDQVSDCSHVKLMTDGILLAEIQNDRFLNRYDTLIIDEAHERSLNIDFLLGYLSTLLPKRPDLKVIITSATIDVERFSKHFGQAPIIEVSGRTYPVEVLYRPLQEEGDQDSDLQQGISAVLEEIEQCERSEGQSPGDVLVFLSGEREIRDTAKALRHLELRHTEVVPLYARLSAAEQARIFQPHKGRRVILSTNVAETSLTVPGIVYVIDTGFARISRYSYRSKVQRLPIEPISQASANQRKGRCGRVRSGICYRLYDEQDFLTRPEFTDPEILRTNLASVILQMLKLGLGDIEAFPFVDPPDSRFIRDGFNLLQELGAVTRQRQITPLGKQLSRLPVDPRIARMVVESARQGSLDEILVIAAALSVQDPRERPADKQQHADQLHREYQHDESDFLTLLNLWNLYEEQRQELTQGQLRKYCKRRMLNFQRMREWRDLHRQLLLSVKELNFKLRHSDEPASYQAVHSALLSGLLSHIGTRGEESEYLGARNRKFHLFPGSVLFKKRPKWVLSAELVETSRLYARINAAFDPAWLESLAQHLLKRNYFEPHWQKKRGQVMGFEQVLLYGLIIVPRRRIDYSKVDAVVAREIFIRSALVEGLFVTKAGFFTHNLGLLQEIDQLEAKSRRRDILVDEETLYRFYDERIPDDTCDARSFESWRKKLEKDKPRALYLTREYLMQHDAAQITEAQYPDHLELEGMRLPLSYHFAPGELDDGVTVEVPVGLLPRLPRFRLEWLVPGMLREKLTAQLRALPKQQRKNFVPIPDYVNALMEALVVEDRPLAEAMADSLRKMSGVRIDANAWVDSPLDDHHRFNIRVLDDEGVLGQGRDLLALQKRYSRQASDSVSQGEEGGIERSGLTRWDFGDLPKELTRQQSGVTIKAWPSLVEEGAQVAMRLCPNADIATAKTRKGVGRLLRLALSRQIKDAQPHLKGFEQSALQAVTMVNKAELKDDLWLASIDRCLLEGVDLPRDEEGFDRLLDRRGELLDVALEYDDLLSEIMQRSHRIQKQLKGKISFDLAMSLADLKQQLARLIYPGFMRDTPWHWLQQYPRYLDAMLYRLDKMGAVIHRDRASAEEVASLWQQYEQRSRQYDERHMLVEPLQEYRWMLEEYRVSLFAQPLKTRYPVSAKRLRKLWQDLPIP